MPKYQQTLCTLATLVSLTISDCTTSTGCSSSASCDVEYVARRVYGCGGVWGSDSPGIASAEFLCADGYSICDTYSWAATLGLTKELCLSNSLMPANYFYASLQSGPGNFQCDETGTDDLFGCASTDSTIVSLDDGINCGPFGAQMSTLSANPWQFGWEPYGDDATELTQAYHWYTKEETTAGNGDWQYTSNVAGGVLCCRDELPAMNTTAMYETTDDMVVSLTDYYSTMETTEELVGESTAVSNTVDDERDGGDDGGDGVEPRSVFLAAVFVVVVVGAVFEV